MNQTSPARENDRAQLELMIADLREGIITLGMDGAIRYANRAALQMHGVAELTGLGGSAEGYHKRFRLIDLTGVPLPTANYPLARLVRGESFSELSVRVLIDGEEYVHELRGLAVPNGAGEADFLALFIEDKTEHYDAEQRFERTFSANPAPALINRLSDLRYIKVNRGFLEMTGFKHEEIIGRTAYEFDVLAGVENRELAVKRFHAGETIPPMESHTATRSGGKKFVIVGGQPLEVNNEPCMLLTFIDLDERKKAEDALKQSEERFSKAFRLAPVAGAISGLDDGRILNINDVFRTLTGYSTGEAVGRTTAELGLWRSEGERIILAALRSHPGYRDLELKLHTKTGEVKDVLASAETVVINDKPCVLCMFHDVTQWKRTEAELIEAINLVMKDPTWFSTTVAQRLRHVQGGAPSAEATAKLSYLTARERQVLELSCRGFGNARIAAELGVAGNTVRNYIAALYKKLGLHSRAELIVWAKRHGLMG